MPLQQLLRDTLTEMDRAVVVLGSIVPEPRAVPFRDSFVFRHVQRLPEQAIVQKLARMLSGLRAAKLLLDNGYFQEQGVMQRVLGELQEDVTFLSAPLILASKEAIHDEYLEAFFAEGFDPATGLPTAQNKPVVSRKKIRAYIARSLKGIEDPSGYVTAGRTLASVYSGYIHAASPNIMDMYGGTSPHFHTSGMLGTDREPEHRRDIVNYYYQGTFAFVLAAHALGNRPQYDHLFALFSRYEVALGT